jgi:hypothetical protein
MCFRGILHTFTRGAGQEAAVWMSLFFQQQRKLYEHKAVETYLLHRRGLALRLTCQIPFAGKLWRVDCRRNG